MNLFSKRSPCPICGGKISWFMPSKIEGQYICDTCNSKIDIEANQENPLTIQSLREYVVFYEQNKVLKNQFVISERIDSGLWDTKIIFDYENNLFCISKDPDNKVFEGKQLKSFSIKEDSSLLYEGSAEGVKRYASTVPERAMALTPQVTQFMINQQFNKLNEENNRTVPLYYFNIPEPFKEFNVELHFEHPYWRVQKFAMDGPRFSNDHPDVNDYIRSYKRSIEEIEKLARALKTMAFPHAGEQFFGSHAASAQAVQTTDDVIEEIKKYKALMEEGIISRQDFDAKKRQLLGI